MDSRLGRDGRAAACVYEPVTLDSYRLRGLRHAGKQRPLRSSSNRFPAATSVSGETMRNVIIGVILGCLFILLGASKRR